MKDNFERRLELLDAVAGRLVGQDRDLVLTAIDDLLASVGRRRA